MLDTVYRLPLLVLPLPLAASLSALAWSIKSFIIWCRSGFFLASRRTSSVVTVVRPAWLLNVSKSVATFSNARPRQHLSHMKHKEKTHLSGPRRAL